jgi:hypothetical protein
MVLTKIMKDTFFIRPWLAEEVPVGAVIRYKGKCLDNIPKLIVGVNVNQALLSQDTFLSLDRLSLECEYSTDYGKTWLTCGVPTLKKQSDHSTYICEKCGEPLEDWYDQFYERGDNHGKRLLAPSDGLGIIPVCGGRILRVSGGIRYSNILPQKRTEFLESVRDYRAEVSPSTIPKIRKLLDDLEAAYKTPEVIVP